MTGIERRSDKVSHAINESKGERDRYMLIMFEEGDLRPNNVQVKSNFISKTQAADILSTILKSIIMDIEPQSPGIGTLDQLIMALRQRFMPRN